LVLLWRKNLLVAVSTPSKARLTLIKISTVLDWDTRKSLQFARLLLHAPMFKFLQTSVLKNDLPNVVKFLLEVFVKLTLFKVVLLWTSTTAEILMCFDTHAIRPKKGKSVAEKIDEFWFESMDSYNHKLTELVFFRLKVKLVSKILF